MESEQLDRIATGQGFFAALDQSGGSTPAMLADYGIPQTAYTGDDEMFDLVQQMRIRIMRSDAFDSERVIGAILFRNTVERDVEGVDTAHYLWKIRRVVPFLKIDVGLQSEVDGAHLMRPIPDLGQILATAGRLDILGTKMRSFITQPDHRGVTAIVEQQFDLAGRIAAAGLVPILEPEIDIHSPGKADAERLLKSAILERLAALSGTRVMLKLTLPEQDDFYRDLVEHPGVLRVLALSGGYGQDEAVRRLANNHGVIASFSRALLEGLSIQQSQPDFDSTLRRSVEKIFDASVT